MTENHPITPPPKRQPSFAELLMPIPKAQVESQLSGDHSITPSPELIAKWASQAVEAANCSADVTVSVATQAARWGADQELEACCDVLARWGVHGIDKLRDTRRPKPPSLKEQASEELRKISIIPELGVSVQALDTIRRALESLPD
jgi:hypothetical protein